MTNKTDRVDPAAYRSAHNVLSRTVPLEEARDQVAWLVAATVKNVRTNGGLDALARIRTDQGFHRELQDLAMSMVPSVPEFRSVEPSAVGDAIRAAARAMTDGTEAQR
jgi:hypothetical protein